MRQIQPETWEYLAIFHNTNPIFIFFLYSLTYCIKKVIKGKIFWRFYEKSASLWGSYVLKQGNPLQFCKILIQLYLFFYFYIFDFLHQRGYQRQYFWTLYLKLLCYEAATSWNRGIHCIIQKWLIKLYFFVSCFIVLLNVSKRLS